MFKRYLNSDQERRNDYGPLRPHHHTIKWSLSIRKIEIHVIWNSYGTENISQYLFKQ
jgi:hypothetical protein